MGDTKDDAAVTTRKTNDPKLPKDKKDEPTLPPCRVCGCKASGFHFGVISCEACKVFFRRYLHNNTPYLCMEQEKCVVKPGRRCCSFCRLQKCLSLGMSKEGIKKGRYTVEKKSKTVKEVKMLKEKEKQAEEKEKQAEEKEKHLKVLIEAMLKIYHENRVYQGEVLDRLADLHNRYVEFNLARQSVFGLKPLAPRVHEDVFRATGMDVDNRSETMATCLACCEHELISAIKYFKKIPDFGELCVDDQCTLMKASFIDLSLIFALDAVDTERMIFTCLICGKIYGEYEMNMIYRDQDFHPLFRLVQQMKDLCLTDDEMAVVIPYVFFSAFNDPDQMKQPEIVVKLGNQVKEALHLVLANSRGQHASSFLKDLLNILAGMKDFSISHVKATHDFISTYQMPNLPSVVHEVYGEESAILRKYLLE